MDYTQIIKEIGRGKDGAGDIDQAVAYELYGNMLDGKVPDFELGAMLVAFRIKAESEAEMQGFYQAMDERVMKLQAPAGKPPPQLFVFIIAVVDQSVSVKSAFLAFNLNE